MEDLFDYNERLVRITDRWGKTFEGVADFYPSEYGMHEFGVEEDSLCVNNYMLFQKDIVKVELLPTFEEAVAAIPPGRYRHFKGGEYRVLSIARHSETLEAMVVYQALYGEEGVWVRPAYMWTETVYRDGKKVQRFQRMEE